MFGMGMQELVIIGVIAVLLFGRRLPEVAKSLGSSYREFRKGLTDLQSHIDINEITSTTTSSMESSYSGSAYGDFDDHDEATAPKFEPPPSEPQAESDDATSDDATSDDVAPDDVAPDDVAPDDVAPDGETRKPVSEK